jgi:hypothetical protein
MEREVPAVHWPSSEDFDWVEAIRVEEHGSETGKDRVSLCILPTRCLFNARP